MGMPRITLKAARINTGLSQKEAAKKLGINVGTLINYESGKTIPNWKIVEKIEKLYSMPKDYINFSCQNNTLKA